MRLAARVVVRMRVIARAGMAELKSYSPSFCSIIAEPSLQILRELDRPALLPTLIFLPIPPLACGAGAQRQGQGERPIR